MATNHRTQLMAHPDTQDGSSCKDSHDGSQLLDPKQVEDMLTTHKATVKARRREVETRLRQAQEEGYAELRRRAEKEQAAYHEDLSLAQRPHLEDLAELLAEKEQLQHKIEKTNDELERAQLAVSQQLGACIKSRVDALRK